jgi:hypothetical protein
MKYEAVFPHDQSKFEVEIINQPKISYQEVEIAMPDKTEFGYMAGGYIWNRLESSSDLEPLIQKNESFNLFSDDWYCVGCRVCKDRKSIYYQNASGEN